MKHLLAVTAAALAAGALGLAHAETGAQAGAGTAKAAAAKASAKAKTAKKAPVVPDRSTAAAPHRYPASAQVKPTAKPLASSASSQAGTVHKDAPLDQVAGAGG